MKAKLSDAVVRGITPPATDRTLVWDTALPGFGVRVTAKGIRTFFLKYRTPQGRQRVVTIGGFPAWGVADARRHAAGLRQTVDQGSDPLAEKAATRAQPTVRDLVERYRALELPKRRPGTRVRYEQILERTILPELGDELVAGVTRARVAKLHMDRKAHPRAANHFLAVLSRLMSIAVAEGLRPDHPVKGLERFPENRREVTLTADQVAALLAETDKLRDPVVGALFRFLLLTGARQGETLATTWDQVDLEAGVWLKPAAATKQKRIHRIPLSPAAVAVLRALPRRGSHVFARTDGAPMLFPREAWRAAVKRAGLATIWPGYGDGGRLRAHDLRHVVASVLAAGGQSLPIIGAMLGHSAPATTARYAHLVDQPLRAAADLVAGAFGAATPAPVVPLKRGRRRAG